MSHALGPSTVAMRRAAVTTAALGVVALLLVLTARPAGAHPLGNFTINHASELVISARSVEVDLVLDLAEIPTQQQRASFTDAQAACDRVVSDLELRVGGDRRPLRTRSAEVAFPPGEASLPTTRLGCRFDAGVELPAGATTIEYRDRLYADRIGWREIIVTPIGVEVPAQTPTTSPSGRLTAYGRSLANPPDQRMLTVTVTVPSTTGLSGGDTDPAGPAAHETGRAKTSAAPPAGDPFTALLARVDDGMWAATLALGVAALLGAMHGLAPGHGKTVVAAYLVGTRGNRRQAVALAAAVALSHTLGVFVLGGVTLAASATFPLEQVFGWLRLTSAVVILAIGVVFAGRVVASRRAAAQHHHHEHQHHEHQHHEHHHHDGHDHGHHDHGGQHDGHRHGPGHQHGLRGHRHAVAWDEVDTTRPLGWRALLALGLSGGMVPSASAIVVLLGAVQLGRVAFGAGLIVAFGVGLSSALVGVGLGVVAVARRTSRRFDPEAVSVRIQRLFAPGAATGLVLAGCYLSIRAVGQLV